MIGVVFKPFVNLDLILKARVALSTFEYWVLIQNKYAQEIKRAKIKQQTSNH